MEMIIPTTRRPDITFHADGRIYITARIARILHLTEESCINVVIHNGEYLLMARNYHPMIGKHTARCHAVNHGSRYFRASSVRLARAMIRAAAATGKKRVALMCGQEIILNNTTYIPIITHTTL